MRLRHQHGQFAVAVVDQMGRRDRAAGGGIAGYHRQPDVRNLMIDDHGRNRQRTDIAQPVPADRSGRRHDQHRVAVVDRKSPEKLIAAVQRPAAEQEFAAAIRKGPPLRLEPLERFARPLRIQQPIVQQPARRQVPREVAVARTADHDVFGNQLLHDLLDGPLARVEPRHQFADRMKTRIRRQGRRLLFQFDGYIVFPVAHDFDLVRSY